MPSSSGRLSKSEKDDLANRITSKLPPGPLFCPVCRHTDWEMQDHIVIPKTAGEPISYLVKARTGETDVSYPQVMLVCTTCSHTLFFNAASLGFYPREEPQGKPMGALSLARRGGR